jgi:hypothetical protein
VTITNQKNNAITIFKENEMSLLQTIKQDQLSARKARDSDTTRILTTLIGEAEMVGKNAGSRESTDEEVRAVVKKFIKNNQELIAAGSKSDIEANAARNAIAIQENVILQGYLPAQLSEDQLNSLIGTLLEKAIKPTNQGVIMKGLKEVVAGQYDYDGALASKLVKDALAAQ